MRSWFASGNTFAADQPIKHVPCADQDRDEKEQLQNVQKAMALLRLLCMG